MLGDQVVGDAARGSGRVLPGVRQSGPQPQAWHGQDTQGSHHDHYHHDGMAGGNAPPPGEHPALAGTPGRAGAGPQPVSQQAHQRGQHRQGDDHRQHDGQGREHTHHREEGDAGNAEAEQSDEHRQPGEHDR